MRLVISMLVLACVFSCLATADFRPPLDKSGYLGTVSVQVNPWFRMDKDPMFGLGGPNVPWMRYQGEGQWARAMALTAEYGIDTWLCEVNEPNGGAGVWREMLDEAARLDIPMKIGAFIAFRAKDLDSCISGTKKLFGMFREDLKGNPRIPRIGGAPVVVLYRPLQFPHELEDYRRLFDALDAEFGRMAFLLNYVSLRPERGEEHFENELRRHLPYFDGVSGYASGAGGIKAQRMAARVLKRVMAEYPGKVRETILHQTYTCHFHMGGGGTDLTRSWRESVDLQLAEDPDAIQLTNLFDHYENSLVLPCYEREDFLLRYLQYRLEGWKWHPAFPKMKTPELVVANDTVVLLGRELKFEVLGFPVDSPSKTVTLYLDVCSTSGKVLHSFPPRAIELDTFRVERYSLPSTRFADERGVVPRLRYTWNGRDFKMNYGPMTVLDPSIRGYRMYYARSTKNELSVSGGDWTLNGASAGGTFGPRPAGRARFAAAARVRMDGHGNRSGFACQTLKRDGTELLVMRPSSAMALDGQLAVQLPDPGNALHWYYLEAENAKGRKFQTLPVWQASPAALEKVPVPIWCEDGKTRIFDIEVGRIPVWRYPCEADDGAMLLDVSGWGHDAVLNGAGYGGGHMRHTGYHHQHGGLLGHGMGADKPLFRRDPDGRGFYRLDGAEDRISIFGGTAFPGACTYEVSVRPDATGREMGIVSSGNGQMSIDILPDGRVRAVRKNPVEGAGGKKTQERFADEAVSAAKLKPGAWTDIAAVYDLERLTLFIDGREEASVPSRPSRAHEWINHVFVGSGMAWVWKPRNGFRGDVRNIRISGRNLRQNELLCRQSDDFAVLTPIKEKGAQK